jgi:pimeloyl-ACP methyl ester carboxylesterase
MSLCHVEGAVRGLSLQRPPTHIPTLMVTGEHDKTVLPNARALCGYRLKVEGLIDIACSSHYSMWEKNHLLLFQASVE